MSGAHVLVVEDEVALRRYLVQYLRMKGAEVAEAGSLAEADVLLDGHRFDAVVLDVGLPDGDGLDLLDRSPPGRALVITANPEPARFARRGVVRHLTKPVDLPEFGREVHALAESQVD